MASIILLKSESYSKKKLFLSWRCPKIIIILTIVLTIHQRLAAIETFQDGPFGRVVEAGLKLIIHSKCFCPNHNRFAGNFSKLRYCSPLPSPAPLPRPGRL